MSSSASTQLIPNWEVNNLSPCFAMSTIRSAVQFCQGLLGAVVAIPILYSEQKAWNASLANAPSLSEKILLSPKYP